MKKVVRGLVLVLVCILLLAGCATKQKGKEDEKIVLPPARVGQGEMKAMMYTPEGFKEAYREADVVARIRIGNWLSEDDQALATFYNAQLIKLYKGNISDHFILEQEGSSKATMKEAALYTHGQEVVVFLNRCRDFPGYSKPYDDFYWILGAWMFTLDVVQTRSGEEYFVDMCGKLGETMPHSITNYAANNSGVKQEIYDGVIEREPLLRERKMPIDALKYAFLKDDVEHYLESLKTS